MKIWIRQDKSDGSESQITEEQVREKIAHYVNDVDLALRSMQENGDWVNTPFAYYKAREATNGN